jgi:hypothetical protein
MSILTNYIDPKKVLAKGEEFELAKIGNHSKGTIFKDGKELNCDALSKVMNSIFNSLKDFNYGRLDIKFEKLLLGRNFKIIELNGVFSEPAHIYDPDYKLFQAWKVLLQHFSELFRISYLSMYKGHKPISLIIGIRKIREHFQVVDRI